MHKASFLVFLQKKKGPILLLLFILIPIWSHRHILCLLAGGVATWWMMKTLKTSFKGGDKSQRWDFFFFLAVETVAAFVFLLVGRAGFVPQLLVHPLLYFTAITWEQLMLYFNIILSSLVVRTILTPHHSPIFRTFLYFLTLQSWNERQRVQK